MEGARKNILAAGGLLAVVASLVVGSMLRERTEIGPDILQQPNHSSLLVSLDDPTVPESDYFYQLSELVKREYVDPVSDDGKLAEGAIRGMINGLADPEAEFLKREQFEAFQNLERGQFEGIGVELELRYDEQQKKWMRDLDAIRNNPNAESPITTPGVLIPDLVVTAVAAGGPADRAGIRVGDRIVTVEGKKVLASDVFRLFQETQLKVRKGQAKASELTALRKALSADAKNGMTPIHAREKLTTGTSGQVKLSWKHGGETKEATAERAIVTEEPVTVGADGVIRLRLFEGAAEKLSRALEGKEQAIIDLRNGTRGSFTAMQEVLEILAKPAKLGIISGEKSSKAHALTVKKGDSTPISLTFLVDNSTRGPAEILALALQASGQAKLEGKTAGEPIERMVVELPTGAGYLLPVGAFKPSKEAVQ